MNDVCLLLEGSYPYFRGGVSSWVHQLVGGLGELSFTVAHLRDCDDPHRPDVYAVPANVEVHDVPLDPDRDEPCAQTLERLPEARVYHALSTGLAGVAGARGAQLRGRPFLLTEHGLAWREAQLGIAACKPVGCKPVGCKPVGLQPLTAGSHANLAERHARWGAQVRDMAREAYARADHVTSVCSVNGRLQRALGAPPERMSVIPNPASEPSDGPSAGQTANPLHAPRIGLVGRVVPIKDVRSFIRACAQVAERIPAARFTVIGPLDHDPDYVRGCRDLVDALGLAERLTFAGEMGSQRWVRELDVAVLTSVSEAAPLVLLEAMAAGLPVISTRVGGCPELVGTGPGAAGLLTPPQDSSATARAIVAVCRDAQLRGRLVQAGRMRASTRHAPERVFAAYHELYERSVSGARAA